MGIQLFLPIAFFLVKMLYFVQLKKTVLSLYQGLWIEREREKTHNMMKIILFLGDKLLFELTLSLTTVYQGCYRFLSIYFIRHLTLILYNCSFMLQTFSLLCCNSVFPIFYLVFCLYFCFLICQLLRSYEQFCSYKLSLA